MPKILMPFSSVFAALSMNKGAIAVGHVIKPVAFIDVSVSMSHLSVTIGLVISPLAFVPAAIRPNLDSITILPTVKQFSPELGTVGKRNRRVDLPSASLVGDVILLGGDRLRFFSFKESFVNQ